jgi:hypothetical protein
MPRRRLAAGLAGAAASVPLLMLFVTGPLQHALSPESFAAHASRGLGRTVVAERVRLAWTPGLRIRAEGLDVEGLGRADAAELELSWAALLRGRVRPVAVRLEEPRIELERTPDGGFAPIFRRPAGEGPGDLGRLPRFEAESGEVRFVDAVRPERPTRAVVRIRSLSVGRFDADGAARLVVAGFARDGDEARWWADRLRLQGRLIQSPERTALADGRFRAAHVRVRWWHGHDLAARFDYADRVVRVDALDVRAFSGRWSASGRIELEGGTRIACQARIRDARVAEMARAMQPDAEPGDLGALRARLDLAVPWRGGPDWSRARGTGTLRIEGGQLSARSMIGSPRPSSVKHLGGDVRIRDGRVHSDDVHLVTDDYRLEATGSVGFDGSLDLAGRVHLSHRGLNKLATTRALPLPDGDAAFPAIPVTIGGRLGDADVDTHVSWVPSVVREAGGALSEAAGDALGDVKDALGAAARRARGWLDP